MERFLDSSSKSLTKYPIVITGINRRQRKTFMTHAILKEAIEKANLYGCAGSKILLEEDGCEICDDETFEYHIQAKCKFMVCDDFSEWLPQNMPITFEETEEMLLKKLETFKHIQRNNAKKVISFKENESSPVAVSAVQTRQSLKQLASENVKTSSEIIEVSHLSEFSKITIPWEKIPSDIMHLLETQQPLERRTNALANLLIDELRLIKHNVPLTILRRISNHIVRRYPQSFVRPGFESSEIEMNINYFLTMMKNRNSHLKRRLIGYQSSKNNTHKTLQITLPELVIKTEDETI